MGKKMNLLVIGFLFIYIFLRGNSYLPEVFYLSLDFLIGVGVLMALNFVRSIFELVRGNGAESAGYFFNIFFIPVFVGIVLIILWVWQIVRTSIIF